MSHILHSDPQVSEQLPQGAPLLVDIFRWDPSSPKGPLYLRYVVPYHRRMSVFTVLREIYERQDRTIAFRNQQCGRGICGTCMMRIDLERLGVKSRLVRGCAIPLQPADHLVIGPANEGKVIRDLVIEL